MNDGLNSKRLMQFRDLLSRPTNNNKLLERHVDMSSEELNRLEKPNVNIFKKLAQVELPVINFTNYTPKIEETESDHLVAEALQA